MDTLANSKYKDYEIVLTDHAKRRCREIGKTEFFILGKIRYSFIKKQSWWQAKRHGWKMKLENGDYVFYGSPKKDLKAIIIVTVINLNLREA